MSFDDYSVNFANGNLNPDSDHPWGPMRLGNSAGPTDHPERYGDSEGLRVSVYRDPGPKSTKRTGRQPAGVANSVYVVPGRGVLPLESRFIMRVDFDLPNAQTCYAPQPPVGVTICAPTKLIEPEPWGVVLNVKSGNENDLHSGDPRVTVSCQFNRRPNAAGPDGGVRLNSPGSDQSKNPATNVESKNLDFPLDYQKYRGSLFRYGTASPTPFRLEMFFWGDGASKKGNTALASGTLNMGNKTDMRLFTNNQLSTGNQDWIGALGITLTTIGTGQVFVRLRNFSISAVP